MTRILTDDDVRAVVEMPELIDTLQAAFAAEAAGEVEATPRLNLQAGTGFLRLMPAVLSGLDRMGFKVFNGSAEEGVRYVVALYEISSGELLSLMDAEHLTSARTGAVTGLAARLLATEDDCRQVGVIGSGVEARTNLAGICAARPVDEALVFSPSSATRAAFAGEMTAELGLPVRAVGTAEEAAACGCVLVATNTGVGSDVVALREEWLADRSLVLTIGSTQPGLRETAVEVFGSAEAIVLDTPHAVEESGDLLAAVAAGQWPRARVTTLSDRVDAPLTEPDRRVFKSVGSALQDVAAASIVHDLAERHGRGTAQPFVRRRTFRMTTKS